MAYYRAQVREIITDLWEYRVLNTVGAEMDAGTADSEGEARRKAEWWIEQANREPPAWQDI